MNTEQALKERAEAILNAEWPFSPENFEAFKKLQPSTYDAILEAMLSFLEQETKTVECYVHVEIKEGCEMPEKQGRYGVIRKNGEMSSRYYYGGIKEFNNQESLSHWLKKTTIKAISK